MRAPRIAVVIPAYNRASTLRRCLDSVVGQTIGPSEVVVVDDGSSDETPYVAGEYAAMGVRCIQVPENAGAQAARNRGIAESTSEWIAFLDSDDEWLPGKIEKQVAALEAVDLDPWTVVHTGAFRKRTHHNDLEPVDLPVVDGPDVTPALLRHPGPLFPALLVSRLALESIGFLDESILSYQEWDTSIRLAQRCRFLFIDEPLFIYHLHENPTISQGKRRDIEGYDHVIKKFETEIKALGGEDAWEWHMRFQLIRCLNWGFWDKADTYLPQITQRDGEYKALQVCRRLHLPPSSVSRARRRLTAK